MSKLLQVTNTSIKIQNVIYPLQNWHDNFEVISTKKKEKQGV